MAIRQTRRSISVSAELYAAIMRDAERLDMSAAHFVSMIVGPFLSEPVAAVVHHSREHSRRAQAGRSGQRAVERKPTIVGFSVVQRIYQQARSHVRKRGGTTGIRQRGAADPAFQAHLRAVSAEFHKRLKAAGIHVEGA